MTAQVAVMNALGVALATDSAVTVSSGVEKAQKIYPSSDKLFQLSDVAPVAIMVSGSSHFLEMPWETVIKVYREQLGKKTFSQLSGYAKDFFRFICTNTKLFPQSTRDEWVEYLVWDLVDNVRIASEKRYKKTDASSEREKKSMSTIIHEVVAESLKEKKEVPKIKGFGVAMDRTLRAKYGRLIAKKRNDTFKGCRLLAKTQRALDNLIVESLSRAHFCSSFTGIVFAGFGESEYMPVCLEYAVEGMIQNKLRYFSDVAAEISSQLPGHIESFGQTEAIKTFLNGVSPEFRSYMKRGIADFVEEARKEESNEEYTDRQIEEFAAVLEEKCIDDIFKKWEDERKSWRPVFDMVESQPKGELAATAEMLVNLAKFRLRVNPEQETVGGPIDVAIITKGDGFVWVKKKQYYPAELNPHKTGPA